MKPPIRSNWRSSPGLLAAVALFLLLVAGSAATEAASQGAKKVNRYIGAQKCKTCHASKETGNQYEALSKMKHAKAFETLASEEAKRLAKAQGIDDPQKADACVKCHVTAFAVPEAEIAKGFDKTMGVQCESCHGPGEQHMKARMAAAADEDPNVPKVYKALPVGELVPDPGMSVCTSCHTKESPSYKPFCHCKFKLEVRHLNPKRERTDAEKAALVKCECKDDCGCKQDCCKGGSCTKLAPSTK